MDGWSPSTLPPHAKLGLLCLVGLLVVWGALDLPGLGIGCKRQIGGWHRKCQVADPPPPQETPGRFLFGCFSGGDVGTYLWTSIKWKVFDDRQPRPFPSPPF